MANKKKLYPRYSMAVNNKMESAFQHVAYLNDGQVPAKDLILLDSLADLLNLYELTREHIAENGISEMNAQGMMVKSPYVKQLTEILVQIQKISAVFGFSTKDNKFITRNTNLDDDELRDALASLND